MRLILAVALAVVMPATARADDTGAGHLQRAEAAAHAGDYATAQREYLTAYDRLGDARIFYELARAYEADGKIRHARIYYRRYLAQVELPETRRREVLAKLAALRPMSEPAPEPRPEPRPEPARRLATPVPAFLPPGATPRSRPVTLGASARTTTDWYGWQIVLSDLTTIIASVATDNGGLFVAGYLLAPSVIHGAHGNGGKAIGSPLLRLGLPLVGGLLGVAIEDCDSSSGEFCGLGGALVGVGVGGISALIIDWSWSKEKVAIPGYVAIGKCQGGTDCTTYGFGLTW